MKATRFFLIDGTKLFLTFLVVNLHVESFVTGAPFSPVYFLGWFAVPLFISLTFYFNAKYYLAPEWSFAEFLHKLWRLLWPFLFWSTLGFLLHPSLISVKYLLRQALTGTAVDPPLYYLLTLCIVSVILYTLRRAFSHHFRLFCLIIIMLSLIAETSGLEAKIFLSISVQIQLAVERILEFLKYAALGIVLPSIAEIAYRFRKFFLIESLGLISIYVTWQWVIQMSNLTYGGVIQFFLVMLTMLMLVGFQRQQLGTWPNRILRIIGPYGLGIYCLHTFFLEHVHAIRYALPASAVIFTLCLVTVTLLDYVSNNRLHTVLA